MKFDFSGAGNLVVHFESRLVDLVKEVRQLAVLNKDVLNGRDMALVKQTAAMAAQNIRHGVTLKQVANFYNNIQSEIIPCQKLMLIGAAAAFEKAVKAKMPTWDNQGQVEEYLDKLKSKTARIRKNREQGLSSDEAGLEGEEWCTSCGSLDCTMDAKQCKLC